VSELQHLLASLRQESWFFFPCPQPAVRLFCSLAFHFNGRKFQFCPLAKFRTKFPSISARSGVRFGAWLIIYSLLSGFLRSDDKQFYKRKP
jgi:hypothetical protein